MVFCILLKRMIRVLKPSKLGKICDSVICQRGEQVGSVETRFALLNEIDTQREFRLGIRYRGIILMIILP